MIQTKWWPTFNFVRLICLTGCRLAIKNICGFQYFPLIGPNFFYQTKWRTKIEISYVREGQIILLKKSLIREQNSNTIIFLLYIFSAHHYSQFFFFLFVFLSSITFCSLFCTSSLSCKFHQDHHTNYRLLINYLLDIWHLYGTLFTWS